MAKKSATKPRGVLHAEKGREHFQLGRVLPPADLEFLIEHFWSVDWDLTGKPPYTSETLPHPSIHAVVDDTKSEVVGVMRGRFRRTLEGKGFAFGIKFRPGAFSAFYQDKISDLTDRRFGPEDFFGASWTEHEKKLRATQGIESRAAMTETFLRTRKPLLDGEAILAGKITGKILDDETIVKVDSLVRIFSISKRNLQRLFSRYIGVSPKWVIERYRMHEALERLASPQKPDLARLAHALGYYDQSHFNRAFLKMTGTSPGAYASRSQTS